MEAIREKILKRELEPGVRIIEKELSEEFGVSRGAHKRGPKAA